MLEVQNLTLSRGSDKFQFDLNVAVGARAVIMGPSGAGKSTLLDLIAGFEKPDGGSVRFSGQDLTNLSVSERPISMLFQANNLFPHISVFKNVALGVTTRRRLSGEQQDRVADTLAAVGLSDFAHRLPNQLSGGQQQRVGLARCLLRDKPLLLLDEPFSALDERTRSELLSVIEALAEKRRWTVVMVSHDPTPLENFATQLLRVVGGRVASSEVNSSNSGFIAS